MSFFIKITALAVVIIGLSMPFYSKATETFEVGTIITTANYRFNNENWLLLPHPRIATFTIEDDGSAYGTTEDNIPFLQYNIPNTLGVRIQRFEIQDHHHYIVEGNIAYTFEELSIQLGRILRDRNDLSA